MSQIDLKPCHCGCPAVIRIDEDHHGEFATLGCSNVNCIYHNVIYTVPTEETSVDKLIAMWNSRPIEDKLCDDNLQLIEQVNSFATMSLDEFALWQNKLKHGGSNETRNQD